jgi:cysteine desulfurase
VALAVGMAAALDASVAQLEANRRHVASLRQLFLERLVATAGPLVVNGPADASPYVVNVSFPGCAGDILLMNLDLAGVACSTGSACSSGSLLPSPVLQAMGLEPALLRSALRFSFSPRTTKEEIVEASHRITLVVNRLREQAATELDERETAQVS